MMQQILFPSGHKMSSPFVLPPPMKGIKREKVKNVLFVHCFPTDNIGSLAITIGTLKVLFSCNPNLKITIVSVFRKGDPRYSFSLKEIKQEFPTVNIIGSPVANLGEIRHRHPHWGRIQRWFWWLRHFTQLALGLLLPRQFVDKQFLTSLEQSDIVCSRGTLIFYDDNSLRKTLLNFWVNSYPLLCSWRLKRPFVFCGHSFGPVNNCISRFFLKNLLRIAHIILVRESPSYELLSKLGIDAKRVIKVPDFAFALEPPTVEQVLKVCQHYGLIPKRYFCVTAMQWGSPAIYKKSWQVLAQSCDWCLEQNLADVCVIIVQAKGLTGIENDEEASRAIFRLMRYKDRVRIIEPTGILSSRLEEALALYGGSTFTIGTRLHSLILSLIAGTPVIGISYVGHRAWGILKDFGLEDYLCDYNNLDQKRLQAMVWEVFKRSSQITAQIHKVRETLKSEVYLSGRLLVNAGEWEFKP